MSDYGAPGASGSIRAQLTRTPSCRAGWGRDADDEFWYYCTLDLGHEGPHEAGTGIGQAAQRWTDDDPHSRGR